MTRVPAVLVDVDGTIADMQKGNPDARGPFDWGRVGEDLPVTSIINLVHMFSKAGLTPVFLSGRDEVCREDTLDWLKCYVQPFSSATPVLLMRAHKDNRPDHQVKLELYTHHVEPHFDVKYVLDDRNQVVTMWRTLGLTCLQVAEGDF